MKLGAVTMAYRDQETIRGTLACLNPFVDIHIVMLQDKPYYGDYEEPDGTLEICEEFDKVEVVHGFWPEHELRNMGMRFCGAVDWVLGFDADEMMTAEDLDKLKHYLSQEKLNAVGFISKVYWRTTDYIFSPDPDHVKVGITRSQARYYEHQCIDSPYSVLDYKKEPFITHHHLSWCEPKNILRKVTHCGHANQYNGAEWYEKYFKNWQEGEPVYQPYMTKWEAKKDPLPEELKRLL